MTAPTGPQVVLVAHGTRYAPGNQVARDLARAVGAQEAYVELADPLLEDVVADADRELWTVPLLLSRGFHTRHDLPRMLAEAPYGARCGPALGPDPLLAQAQADRLREAGWAAGDQVVLVAAGSRDPASLTDLELAGRLLADACGVDVRVATLSGVGPALEDVLAEAARDGEGHVAVSPYLLSPGFFADRFRERSYAALEAAGAPTPVVAEVIGAHPRVVELIEQRIAALQQAPAVPRPVGSPGPA